MWPQRSHLDAAGWVRPAEQIVQIQPQDQAQQAQNSPGQTIWLMQDSPNTGKIPQMLRSAVLAGIRHSDTFHQAQQNTQTEVQPGHQWFSQLTDEQQLPQIQKVTMIVGHGPIECMFIKLANQSFQGQAYHVTGH